MILTKATIEGAPPNALRLTHRRPLTFVPKYSNGVGRRQGLG
jgi:hypothetical protein